MALPLYDGAERRRSLPVVVRGSGTGLVGGAVAIHGGIMLDTSLMKKVLELDENNLTVTVQSGILLMELAAYCEERGWFDSGRVGFAMGSRRPCDRHRVLRPAM